MNYFINKMYGNDTNPGTATNPFKNIEKAEKIVKPGDIIIFEYEKKEYVL